jgi:hypothetical protein
LSISCISNAVFPSLKQNFAQMGCSFKWAISLITENHGSHLTCTTINTHWAVTQRIMAEKLTRLTHKIAIQLHLVAESFTICSSCSRQPVQKLLDTPLYLDSKDQTKEGCCSKHSLEVSSVNRERAEGLPLNFLEVNKIWIC